VLRTSIRWRTWCECEQDTVRPVLADRLGDCAPRPRSDRPPIKPGDVTALALADMPPMSMKLAMLEMGGMSTRQALDKLGVRRENRSRVIAGRTGGVPKRRIQMDAKPQVMTRIQMDDMPAHPNGCNTAGHRRD
jgi:hypothetical protein